MNSVNTPDGVTNREISEAVSRLFQLTVDDKISWAPFTVPDSPPHSCSYRTDLDDFVVTIGLEDKHPTLLIEDRSGSATTVARVDAVHPPELSVRARLAGDIFGLLYLVEQR